MKKKLVIAAVAVAGIGTAATSAYADEMTMEGGEDGRMEMGSDHAGMRMGPRMDMGAGEGGRMGPRMGSGAQMGPRVQGENRSSDGKMRDGRKMAEGFFRTDLSESDRAAIKASQEKHHAAMVEIMDALKAGTITKEEFATKAKAIAETHMNEILPFVAEDKMEIFKKEMERLANGGPGRMENGQDGDRPGRPGTGSGAQMGPRGPRMETDSATGEGKRPNMPRPAAVLPKGIDTAIDAKLAAMTTNEDKTAWLNGVITKVKALEEKAKKPKNKAVLKALGALLTQKLEEIQSSGEADLNLNDLLQ